MGFRVLFNTSWPYLFIMLLGIVLVGGAIGP